MARGRQRENWMHTSQLMALLANIHRGEESDAMSWEHWHPHYDPPEPPEATRDQLIAFGFRPVEESNNGG